MLGSPAMETISYQSLVTAGKHVESSCTIRAVWSNPKILTGPNPFSQLRQQTDSLAYSGAPRPFPAIYGHSLPNGRGCRYNELWTHDLQAPSAPPRFR